MTLVKEVKLLDDGGNSLTFTLTNEGRLYITSVVYVNGRKTGTGLAKKFLEQRHAETSLEKQVAEARELGWELPS
jgi:hypothetical protein